MIKIELTKEEFNESRNWYLLYNTKPPTRFGLFHTDKNEWTCQFLDEEGVIEEGFTEWLSGENAVKFFFNFNLDFLNNRQWE